METAQPRYSWTDPDAYEVFMGRWSERLASPFLSLADVASGGHVLDLACGTGVLTKALADAGAHVIGIDASEGYLEGARRHRSHPNIAYEQGDIRHLRFGNGAFDAAVSTLALDVLPEIEQVLAEMGRVTRPGGVVASGVHQFWRHACLRPSRSHRCRARRRLLQAEIQAGGAPDLLAKRSGGVVAEDGLHQRDGGSRCCGLRVPVLRKLLGYVHWRPRQHLGPNDGALGGRAWRD
jgi:SAM-dependent methyltransferase